MRHAAGLAPEDRLAISDLVHRYAVLVDAGEVDAVMELFTTDAVMVVPSRRPSSGRPSSTPATTSPRRWPRSPG